jgi:hypothetical protein
VGRHLLTSSLYGAWRWSYDAPEDDREHARSDLLSVLRREEFVPTPAMLEGRKFEADVRGAAERQLPLPFEVVDPRYDAAVQEVAEIVRGGLWQQRLYLDLKFAGYGNFLLYGKADVMKGPLIADIKWKTKSNYQIGQYGKGLQHLAYPAASGCTAGKGGSPRFAYLASDGKSVWREDYFYSRETYEELRSRLVEMLDDLKRDRELGKLYYDHWQADRWAA